MKTYTCFCRVKPVFRFIPFLSGRRLTVLNRQEYRVLLSKSRLLEQACWVSKYRLEPFLFFEAAHLYVCEGGMYVH